MDKLLEDFAETFEVSDSTNSVYSQHPRFNQYKQRTKKSGDQNERRNTFLKQQRKRRCDFLSHVRCLAENEWDDYEDCSSNDENMDVEIKVRPPKRYKDQLMLSEWLVEVPDDFSDKWLMLVCPIGKRNLIVAAKGRTSCYSKSGYCISTFLSALPGGSPETRSGYTVLDCIYSSAEEIFYVLDVMCWNNHPVYDSETEFRFFWLQSKLHENEGLAQVSKTNTYKILGLASCACSKEDIATTLENCNPSTVDGLLFYHKQTHYTFGTTPLVTWLKVPMVKKILGITPPTAFTITDCAHKMVKP